MELRDEGMCFACGQRNPIGLKLVFAEEGNDYVARFAPGRNHQGYAGVIHGGIISALLDEAMARLVYARGYRAVTAEMSVRFRKPVRVGDELIVIGRMLSEKGRVLLCSAELRGAGGELMASAEGKMMKV